jgi:non-canonical poly(A) RNA polymerase PAPD5/7
MPTWKAKKGEDPTPWLQHDHSKSPKIGVWLHKELVDWYDYVKPRDFEHDVRTQIVEELKSLVRRTYRNAEVYPFGSFPSGLYLPSADVDLAFLSDSTWNRGPADPRYTRKNFLYKLREFLVQKRIAKRDDIELVIGAKVPIVKYIDQRTSTKVDISFEKVDGVHAVQTFLDWKAQYPVMPLLVTAIKHFLLMRGLNEPFNGGIGGFSVICLVVSMLQLMPEIQSRSMNPMHHVGELLLAFFDLYGNRFNYHTTAISLSPPGYIPKYQVQDFVYKRHDRLSIIDPNNPANDIAAGSSNFPKIVSAFSAAHRELRARMAYLSTASDAEKKDASILEVIFAGDYSSFRLHREHYAKLARQGIASLESMPAAPPPRSQW